MFPVLITSQSSRCKYPMANRHLKLSEAGVEHLLPITAVPPSPAQVHTRQNKHTYAGSGNIPDSPPHQLFPTSGNTTTFHPTTSQKS